MFEKVGAWFVHSSSATAGTDPYIESEPEQRRAGSGC
jgi:hypothetical protein